MQRDLADAHAVAPRPVSVLFSGVMVTAGRYAVARVTGTAFVTGFAPHLGSIGRVFMGFAFATALSAECSRSANIT